jgi:hypothetical protein
VTVDVAMAEALLDMGLDLPEVAGELGCDVAALERALNPEVDSIKPDVAPSAKGGPAPTSAIAPTTGDQPGRASVVEAPTERPGMGKGGGRGPAHWDRTTIRPGKKTAPDHDGQQDVKLAAKDVKHLIAWTGADDHIVQLCDGIEGAGRMAPFKVDGKLMSRAGIVRLVAEEAARRRYATPLVHLAGDRQRALILAVRLSVESLLEVLD